MVAQTVIMRGGVAYCQTTVMIPLELKERALGSGICLAKTLTHALEEELHQIATGKTRR
jgi:hypothetical protein